MDSVQKPILKERVLYRDEIYEYFRKKIIAGDLKPGDRIVETRWAKELGVSQSPVREAIRELELNGLVENKPFYGTFVKEISKKNIIDAFKVRISLEVLAVKEAIKVITDEQLEEIHSLINAMEDAAEENDIDLFIDKDALFHEKIVKLADNEMLLKLWSQCHIVEWTQFSTITSKMGIKKLATRHEDVYNALFERNVEKAVEIIASHVQELMDEIN